MEQRFLPKKDITYCTNDKCSQKENCYRWQGHWNFSDDYYSFCEFSEKECSKEFYK